MDSTTPFGRLYGAILRRREVRGLALTETSYPPRLRLPRHSHGHAYFCLVLAGAYTETYTRGARACRPSDVIFHPAGEAHADQFADAGGRCFNVQFSPVWLERLGVPAPSLGPCEDADEGALAWLAARLYGEFRAADDLAPLAIEGLALEMFVERARRARERATPPWIETVTEYLRAHFVERLTLSEVAGAAGVHPVHLAREFRRRRHCTVGEYVRRLRVEFACRELSATDAPLAEIALAAGFSHQSHLTRTFKALTGTTPAKFRALSRAR
jgi:AraC family transcriptional regulator